MDKNKDTQLIFSVWVNDRLDVSLAALCQNFSRSQIQTWIKAGHVKVNDETILKPRYMLNRKDEVVCTIQHIEQISDEPEVMDLNIIFEDEHLLLINKPSGVVTHPGAGIKQGTLMNGLLHHCPNGKQLPRAGIVHRLDKDTSGLMVIAKTNEAYLKLVEAFKNRTIKKSYQALVYGRFKLSTTISAPIGRHPQQRTKMAVVKSGKEAISHITVLDRYKHFSHLNIDIETGRTHQIRVHLAHYKHPIVGDRTYGRQPNYADLDESIKSWLNEQHAQLLHAHTLTFNHPYTNQLLTFHAPIGNNYATGLKYLTEKDQ
jgi:23S rRNA pseudouridine1911/1915/1917 synthase